MFYVYVLRSRVDGFFYTGCTADLKRRLAEHSQARVESTRRRVPFDLIYYEACRDQKDALRREKYLKTTYGHRYLRNRLRNDLAP